MGKMKLYYRKDDYIIKIRQQINSAKNDKMGHLTEQKLSECIDSVCNIIRND